MRIEAKDVYGANHLLSPALSGYTTRTKDGQCATRRFVNSLDFSLDLQKMRELYEKIYRRNNFTFNINNHDYTTTAICVNFTYAFKEYNRIGKNIYVKAGFDYSSIDFKDSVSIINEELAGIILNECVQTPIRPDILGPYFQYNDGKYQLVKDPKTLITRADLRRELYKSGFYCDGIHYVRFKRSSGSSRVGKCLFIDEALYKQFHKWDLCGLEIKEGDEIDLAAFEAYISLPSSSIIDTLQLEPKNFLLISDYESSFTDRVVCVDYKEGRLVAEEKKPRIKNSIFDGESLLDYSLFGDKYADKGMLLLRNRFFKSACFNTNIQKWFSDHGITKVSQLNGETRAENLDEIKIITTPSSIKYLKFSSFSKWLDNLDTTFGIVKYEKPTHYLEGQMVQCHYQLINTLPLSYEDVEKLLKPNLDYITQIRNDPAVLRYHIKYPYDDSEEMVPMTTKNEIIFRLLGMNAQFCKTKLYYEFRDDLVRSLLRNLRKGHVWIHGNYSTLLGNGIEMLQHSIGTFDGKSVLGIGNIHCKNFEYGKTLLGSRSPHINSGNILLSKNVANEQIDSYFNLSNEIVCINAINENIQQRLNGCDYDSDTIMLTDNLILIKAAKKNYTKFKVPTCMVKSKKVKRHYTSDDMADLDLKTSVNKIGEIVNLSQYLNSIMWDNINKGQTVKDNKDIYYDICILAVLSGIEIDRAKKEYELSSSNVIKELKEKWKIESNGKCVKPMFFKMITKENGYDLNPRHKYKYFHTPMDYLQKQIGGYKFWINHQDRIEPIPFSQILKEPSGVQYGGKQYSQRDRIISLIEETKNSIKQLYLNYSSMSKEDKDIVRKQADEIQNNCIDYLSNILFNDYAAIYLILKTLDDPRYNYMKNMIFTILFGSPKEVFYNMIDRKNEEVYELIQDQNGTINIFGTKMALKQPFFTKNSDFGPK